ncbi:hypothetical protein UU9_10502 [Rhodanobacter fulvus Jip2]|uniref:Uncharacterized protein n=1 Tax=Rhodanobacter fulvus Jip2 TaxID=1163408 RepID=I4VPC8_9GAMM|nr:hypothetical protein [Rhodanobacter fulvus]EIL89069.1 hypothetical protein UU9_10502 [Rhodanobacter fulvus Jip2]
MIRIEDFVADGVIPDIAYRTAESPEEVIHPRVDVRDGMLTFYSHKERHESHRGYVLVSDFLERLAQGEVGLAITGNRPSNGLRTTITFDRVDRITISPRLEQFLAELRATGRVADTDVTNARQAVFDVEARRFLDGFMASDNPQFVYWLPRYTQTLARVREALSRKAPEDLFDLIWKSRDNAVSNAGQGVMGFAVADRLRGRLIEVIGNIAADGSPATFGAIIDRFEQWRVQGELASVPRLLVARAFAAVHPERYHTTVDASKQERIVPWFAEHTGFVAPEGGWAAKAAALSNHLARCGVFGGDLERQNMFPWFVFEQLRGANGKVPFRPGHTSKLATGDARGSPEGREIDYRHNVIQDCLFELLCARHGEDAVGTERPTGTGGRADALVCLPDGRFELYEIKPAPTAADAVRQAMGQLLEYAYRRGGLQPVSMHVVSDAPLDEITSEFLSHLRSEFALPIEYLQIACENGDER